MASRHVPLGGDEWRAALASNFNGLIPDRPSAPDTANAMGRLAAAQLGDVTAFHVAGNSQVLRRSDAWARRLPSDLLKVCIQPDAVRAVNVVDGHGARCKRDLAAALLDGRRAGPLDADLEQIGGQPPGPGG
jgi:hypothetical protein